MIMIGQLALLRYYIALGWWLIKLGIIIFLIIPGTVPMMVGYLISMIYRVLDPNLMVFYFVRNTYITTLGSLPMIGQIIIFNCVFLCLIIVYVRMVRRKYPDQKWEDIYKNILS